MRIGTSGDKGEPVFLCPAMEQLPLGAALQAAALVRRMQAEFALLDEFDGGAEEEEEEEEAEQRVEEDEEEEPEEEAAKSQPARPVPSPRPAFERDASTVLQLPTMDRSQKSLEAVPQEVWERPWLTRLSLARNRLAAVDGERLSQALTALTVLDLSHNPLTSLSLRLAALRELRLSGCPLASLALFAPALSLLSLDGARLDGANLSLLLSASSLPSLCSLSLAGCALSALPAGLDSLALTFLDLSRNCLTALPPLASSLRQLLVSENGLLASLGPLPAALERCVATRCALTGVDLSLTTQLEHLDLRYNAIDSAIDLRSCSALRELHCGHNGRLSQLRLCESLESLNLDCTGIAELSNLPQSLTRLCASCCPHLERVSGQLPDALTELRLCFDPLLTQLPPLPSLALTGLWLAHCSQLGLALPSCPQLRTLVFSNSPKVVPPAPLSFPALTVLRAAGCQHRLELTALTGLEQIDVSHCAAGEAPLEASSLREVECAGCPWLALEGEAEHSSHRFVGPADIGAAQALGQRPTMEDAWGGADVALSSSSSARLAVLCDGHAGREAASFVASHLLDNAAAVCCRPAAAIAAADAALRTHLSQGPVAARHAGTTVLLACRETGSPAVTVANVGDSRALRVESARAGERVSRDHKPWDEEEAVRGRGGWVAAGRVNGVLGVARALGDFYLRPALSPEAHVASCPARGLLVLGCDGLFDELPDALVANLSFQSPGAEAAESAASVAARLRDAALALGSDDNVSVLVWPL